MDTRFYVATLNKYPDILAAFLSSVRQFEPGLRPLVIADGWKKESDEYEIITAPVNGDFVFARNANLALKSSPNRDVILCNDDIVLREPDTFKMLFEFAQEDKKIGILSPLIDGGVGNPFQNYYQARKLWPIHAKGVAVLNTVCFICVYLRRQMLEEIGLLDENFTGYGGEDDDMCMRARKAGWLTAITRIVTVRHGVGGSDLMEGRNWSSSYVRRGTKKQTQIEYLQSKHTVRT